MTNQVSIFKFEDKDTVRVVKVDGEPWFVAVDVYKALSLALGSQSYHMSKLGEDEKGYKTLVTPGGPQSLRVVSESGLYKLIMRSKTPGARRFQEWVTRTVLPAIRKDGAYIMGEEKPCNQLPCSEGSRVPARKETHMSKEIIGREYEGKIFVFRADGYFNMTSAAKKFGKFLPNFMRSPETTDYMEALSSTVDSTALEIVDVVPGNRYVEGRGTWAHPKLAVFFARWLDVKFAVWCDMVIDDILNKRAELTITKPAESVALKVPQSFPEALRLAAELAERNEKLAATSKALHYEPAT